jgi:hypothetical protein
MHTCITSLELNRLRPRSDCGVQPPQSGDYSLDSRTVREIPWGNCFRGIKLEHKENQVDVKVIKERMHTLKLIIQNRNHLQEYKYKHASIISNSKHKA